MKLRTIALTAAATLSLASSALCQVPGVIGVKFGFTAGAAYAVSTDLAPTDAAGILVDGALAVTNWNNLLVASVSPLSASENVTWDIAQDSAGNGLTGVTLTPAGLNDGWYSGGSDCPNARLMEAFWKLNLNDANAGVGKTSGGHTYATYTFANLPGAEYDVYVYVNDNSGNYWGNVEANSVIAVGASVDSAGFNGAESDPCGLTPQLHTATGYNNAVNYVEMPAVATTAGGTIVISLVSQGGNEIAVPGIELVPTGTVVATGPPLTSAIVETPSTAAIAAVAGATVTLSADAVGSLPITYQWLTDGGTGGTLTNIPGATGTNLEVNTTGWALGTYNYEYMATNSLGGATSSESAIVLVPVVMADIGTNTPKPGLYDISQLISGGQADDGFNFYTDDGAGHGAWAGQTFTTGSNPAGYVMNSLSWLSAGNGNSFPNFQLYDLYIYTLSAGGATATQLASYQAYGGGKENDWLEWVGLNTPLLANTQYAYAFGRDSTSSGWEHIADEGGAPYAGGQICTVPSPTGGTVTYGNAPYSDEVFDIGLTLSFAPFAVLPTYSPDVTPVYAATTVTLAEAATGQPPLSYQWWADGGTGTLSLVSGATSTNLAIDTTSYAPGNYEFAVVVTNSYGVSTSAVLTLAVSAASAPQIVTDTTPAPAAEVYVGGSATFSATFAGTLPMTYQWMLNNAPISSSSNPSAISNTLVLTDVQLASAGSYSVLASNSVGGLSSTASTLVVFSDPAAPAAGSVAALTLSNEPVGFWQLGDTNDPATGVAPAYDSSGHNLDGLYGATAQVGVVGQTPPTFPGFSDSTLTYYSQPDTTNAAITLPPLNLDTNTITITMWINPSSGQTTYEGLLMNRNGNDGAGFGFGGTENAEGMPELGYTWNTNASSTWGFNSYLYPPANQWSFVALVVEPSQATIYLDYINSASGQPELSSAINAIPQDPEDFSGGSILIGNDAGGLTTRSFNGYIDQVAVFNKALTSGQILAMFGAGTGFSAIAPSITAEPESASVFEGKTVTLSAGGVNGTPPLTYQWQFDGTNIVGATNATLSLGSATSANAGSYQLFVTSPVGVATSSVTSVSIAAVPTNSYVAAALQYGPLAYWPLDELSDPSTGTAVAYDNEGFANGTYGIGAQNGFNTILGPEAPAYAGFPTINYALESSSAVTGSFVSASAGTMTASNLTYTMWINPPGPVQEDAGLLVDRGAEGEGFAFDNETNTSGMAGLGYVWNDNNEDTWGWNSFVYPPTNEWSLVAMVIQPAYGAVYCISSGGFKGATNYTANDTEEFGPAWHIGGDSQGDPTRTFPGMISSVAVYTSALTVPQLQALYDVGTGVVPTPPPVTLYITSSSAGNVTLTWSQGSLWQASSLTGSWTAVGGATSPYTTAAAGSQMFYKVLVQ